MRGRFGDLALEALMVVFAVLVALGVEEWRDERELHAFADQARAAVVAEVRANLEELQRTGPGLARVAQALEPVVDEGDVSQLAGQFSVDLPEVSTAAWSAAQMSRAAPYIDYEWLIRVARAYEIHATYIRIGDRLIDAMGAVIRTEPSAETLGGVYGYVVILTEIHGQLEDRLEAILAESAR